MLLKTHSPAEVDELVRKTLSKPASWPVPKSYTLEYIRHLQRYPLDTNFVVDPDERTLTCTEAQCFVELPIEVDSSGRFDLAVYAAHITNSDLSTPHLEARNKRLGISPTSYPSASTSAAGSSNITRTPADTKPVRSPITLAPSHRRPLALHPTEASPSKRPRPSLAEVSNQPFSHTPPRITPHTPTPSSSTQRPPTRARAPTAGPSTSRPAADRAAQLDAINREIASLNDIAPHQVADFVIELENDQPEDYHDPDADEYQVLTGVDDRTAELIAQRREVLFAGSVAIRQSFAHVPSPRLARGHRTTGSAATALINRAIAGAGSLLNGILPPVTGYNHGPDPDEDADFIRDYDQGVVRSQEFNASFNEFLTKAAADDLFDQNATVEGAWAKLGLTKQNRVLPNMGDTQLMAHQVIGVSWMVEQEKSKAYGGILADEMGLGKTVQTIATMVMNESTDPKEKTTLVVAPVALLEQWKAEIKEKLDRGYYSIFIYHGANKKDITHKDDLLSYDVVITTYQTVVNEWFDLEAMVKNAKLAAEEAGEPRHWREYRNFERPKGYLFDCPFYRIVLDEAQIIRNKRTKASRAVSDLDGLLRWCLTGTPITNKLEDVFPLLRFLQIKPWYDWDSFRAKVLLGDKKAQDQAAKRLQVILRPHLLRRKKDSQLNGQPILQLPARTVELQSLEFTEEERAIYAAVETQSQVKFNKYLRAGTVLKNYATILVMITRLRQICFHAALIGDSFDEAFAEREKMTDIERAVSLIGEDGVAKLKKTRLELAVDRVIAERDGNLDELELEECPICFEPATGNEEGAVITRCGHVFCKPCMQEVLDAVAQEEAEQDGPRLRQDQRPCPACRGPISSQETFNLASFEPESEDVDKGVATGRSDRKPNVSGKGKQRMEVITLDDSDSEDDEDEVASARDKGKGRARAPLQPNRAVIQDSEDDEEVDQLAEETKPPPSVKKLTARDKAREAAKWRSKQEPSTKMVWVLNEIRRLQQEDPDDKIIISSSFTTALDMVEDHLTTQNIRVVRYQGDMNTADRQTSIKVLMKSKKCFVLLMSIKSGGVGLNLTRANRWISLDLAWSNAVEEQAFARIHRIGQNKEVRVDRLTIARTVEQRIQELQEHKQKLADASLGEGTGAKIGRLSVAQLAGLFGLTPDGERIPERAIEPAEE